MFFYKPILSVSNEINKKKYVVKQMYLKSLKWLEVLIDLQSSNALLILETFKIILRQKTSIKGLT